MRAKRYRRGDPAKAATQYQYAVCWHAIGPPSVGGGAVCGQG
jgi:hypothetical protein